MIDVRKSMTAIETGVRGGIAAIGRNPTHPRRLALGLSVAAVLAVAGCSWFGDESKPAPESTPAKTQQSKATPEPGEGETVGGSEQEAKIPDINSVPTEAPKPTITNLDQVQQGLGSDTANSQHTDETLTMPDEQAQRPEAPAPESQPQTAQATEPAPAAPAPAEPAPAPVASAPAAAEPAPAPVASAPAAEAPAPAPAATPAPAPAPAQTQVAALVGTPQPGSKPFEPKGPLNLVPGSLSHNAGTASATTQAAAAPSAITEQPTPMPAQPAPSQPMAAPAKSPDTSISVDYTALGIQPTSAAMLPRPAAPAPVAPMPPVAMPATPAAGVGQAVGLVYFGDGSAGLSAADRDVLRQVAELQRLQGGVLRIIGHASQHTGNLDPQRQQEVNRRVSLARATSVARALVGMGVQPFLVQVAAAGDNQTLYSESTPAGEAGNRRAEVYLSQN
jgi:flagellar motor protein MotB